MVNHEPKHRAYCPSCRAYFAVDSMPPHAVAHRVEKQPNGEEVVVHFHPITGEVLRPALSEAEEAMLLRPEVRSAFLFELEKSIGAELEEAPNGFSKPASVWMDGVRRALSTLRETL